MATSAAIKAAFSADEAGVDRYAPRVWHLLMAHSNDGMFPDPGHTTEKIEGAACVTMNWYASSPSAVSRINADIVDQLQTYFNPQCGVGKCY